MLQTFGNRLRDVRQRLKMSQQELAARTGITQATLSNYERGVKKPSIQVIERLASGLNLAALDLVANTDQRGRYTAARVSPADREIQERAEARKLSAKVIAIHEIYCRIVALAQEHLVGDVLNAADAYGEALLQHLGDQLGEACNAAAAIDDGLDMREQLYVPSDLDPHRYVFDMVFLNEEQEQEDRAIRASKALILKWVLRYPDADDDVSRSEISARLRLARVDVHLRKLELERERAATEQPKSFGRPSLEDDDIPF